MFIPIFKFTESFAAAAFFVIFNNVICSKGTDDFQSDIDLLQSVSRAFQKLDQNSQVDTYLQKLSQIFQVLLSILCILKPQNSTFNCKQSAREADSASSQQAAQPSMLYHQAKQPHFDPPNLGPASSIPQSYTTIASNHARSSSLGSHPRPAKDPHPDPYHNMNRVDPTFTSASGSSSPVTHPRKRQKS